MRQIELIEYLALSSSARFISDLPCDALMTLYAVEAIRDPDAFDVEEWNRAGEYLTDSYVRQQTPSAAKDELLAKLRKKSQEKKPQSRFCRKPVTVW